MRTPTNIRWEAINKLPKVDGHDGKVNADLHPVLFEYNGYKVEAVVSFILRCESKSENYNLEAFDHWTDTEVELFEVKEMFIDDGEDFKLPLKEFRELEDYLGNDLQTQF